MRPTSRLALSILFLASFARLALGQNLLANPNFNTSVASWNVPQPFETAVWKDVDANGSPSSGAADLTNAFSQPGTMGGGDIEQCVPVTGGASYDFGAKAFIPSQSNTGYAQAQVAFYSGTNCGGSFLSLASTLHVTQIAAWGQVAVAGALAPAGAVSADFALAHFKNEAGGEFVTYFDS